MILSSSKCATSALRRLHNWTGLPAFGSPPETKEVKGEWPADPTVCLPDALTILLAMRSCRIRHQAITPECLRYVHGHIYINGFYSAQDTISPLRTTSVIPVPDGCEEPDTWCMLVSIMMLCRPEITPDNLESKLSMLPLSLSGVVMKSMLKRDSLMGYKEACVLLDITLPTAPAETVAPLVYMPCILHRNIYESCFNKNLPLARNSIWSNDPKVLANMIKHGKDILRLTKYNYEWSSIYNLDILLTLLGMMHNDFMIAYNDTMILTGYPDRVLDTSARVDKPIETKTRTKTKTKTKHKLFKTSIKVPIQNGPRNMPVPPAKK